jgi:hypothetical protein
MHRAAASVAVSICALALAAPATATHGGQIVRQAAEALVSDPVYVHPDAIPSISAAEADELRDRIARAGGGTYVAVLPSAALHEGGTAEGVLRELAGQIRRRGTYAAVVGGSFRAGSNGRERGAAAELAAQAFREHRTEGAGPTLLAFVDAVAARREGRTGAEGDGDAGDDGSELAVLGVLGAAAAGGIAVVAVRRRRRAAAELGQVKEAAEEDLVALAEDVQALELDVQMPGADPRAAQDYGRAVEAYERASGAFGKARTTGDLETVTGAVDEGRYAMASARARLEGRDPPERTPPCFFDPRHGPSVGEVDWEPPYGEVRPVPACETCAARVAEGVEPDAREVPVGAGRTAWWNAGPAYSGWAGGFYGGAAGMLLPALLMGSMLGAGMGFGAGPAYGSDGQGYGDSGYDGGGDDLGDVGGGDFGDFGGGDFGGGDFGGGDF